jgi:hypothetical protein
MVERAIAEVANLPEATQEKLGRELLAQVEKLRSLRAEMRGGLGTGRADEFGSQWPRFRAKGDCGLLLTVFARP